MLMTFLASSLGCGAGAEASKASDEAAARELFDRAIAADLEGDAVAADRLQRQLQAEHPRSRYATRLTSSGGDAVGTVAVIGMLSAIGLPAFMKYIRRSKTSEATMNLRKLLDASVAYYHETQRATGVGRFPATVALTPERPACQGDTSVKITPRPGDWDHPSWAALAFEVSDPHYYHYEYVSEGSGATARFTARALGDLNCDGVLSTFERIGFIDEEGNVNGGAGIFKRNELE